jgi:predicted acylesterase/phospholipase RssA
LGLALAGGGPLGMMYELGALRALEESLEGLNLNAMDVYVGVSAGAVVAACLANGFTAQQLCRVLVLNESEAFPLDPERFMRPAVREYLRQGRRLPALAARALQELLRHPWESGLLSSLNRLAAAIPAGIFDNEGIHDFLAQVFASRGRSNDFRELAAPLFVVAVDLDSGESVRFGARGFDHVPISRAVQASTALPGLYPPVVIDGEHYVDGALQRTLHASAALEAGARLLFCINPIVPLNARLSGDGSELSAPSLAQGGLVAVLGQTFRALVHSRMSVGMAQYRRRFPDRDIVLFEPERSDAGLFFTNVFSFSNRQRVCEQAYQSTRRDLLAQQETMRPLLARHGLRLRTEVLADSARHFDTHFDPAPEFARLARLRNPVTNRLSATLDRLERALERRR